MSAAAGDCPAAAVSSIRIIEGPIAVQISCAPWPTLQVRIAKIYLAKWNSLLCTSKMVLGLWWVYEVKRQCSEKLLMS
jgi:hypothetical protein